MVPFDGAVTIDGGPPMFASHVPLIGCTGICWMFECQTLLLG